ncbi:RNA-binding domain-containing protein [Aspergillus sclerotioniger CBS 115572]|uniref:RNA-binding domain-containing protein n=1 Tax=Aspergillus sclerotioniger CBS 115572 TaxID=1450535 RepID=A0A317VDI6_9EURO|nr:RNA-binding domain-containing protein [Aspergillus sclerotioniger CBS 115572]PWY71077.1 RNA-binding domain-containing protein [Aspergillus sclerotioniger CBS 115572]
MHSFRAACRLLSLTAPAPLRSTQAIPSFTSRVTVPLRISQPLLQSRWNSNEVKPQSEPTSTDAPAETPVETPVESESREPTAIRFVKTEEAHSRLTEEERVAKRREQRNRLLSTPPSPKETVFIGNLFYDVTAEDLRRTMEKYGTVEKAIIVFDSRGLSRGYGYVQFDTIETAQRAISAMHLRLYEGRRVTVQFAQNNMNHRRVLQEPSKTLYIGNLPFEMTDRDINELFKDVQNVIDVRVAVDRRTGQPRGFAHAQFISVASAQQGFAVLENKKPYGRTLRLNYSKSTNKSVTEPLVKEIENNTE